MLLHEINLYHLVSNKCDYASIFFNAGAHIQHYFLFNSRILDKEKNPEWYVKHEDDPVLEVLSIYDDIVGDYLKMNCPFILATGLSQVAYDRKKFYYRLINHKRFLQNFRIKFSDVKPRMSRDFSIFFDCNEDRDLAYKNLSVLKEEITKISIFGDFEFKDKELFVTLSFPEMIDKSHHVLFENNEIFLKENTVFVCIKNGMHNEKGYAFFSNNFQGKVLENNSHVRDLHKCVINHFEALASNNA